MNCSTRPAARRWALLVLTVSTLALAGCGRKGGLDLPPQGGMQPSAAAAEPASVDPEANSAANKGTAIFSTSSGDDSQPQAARGRKKSFLLDPLLD